MAPKGEGQGRQEDTPGLRKLKETYDKEWQKEGFGRVCPIPYGQFARGTFTAQQLDDAKEYWFNLERSGQWPSHLLSFEAWCGMTLYDRTKEDGGPQFQHLMLLVLAKGRSEQLKAWPGVSSPVDFDTMWDAEKREYGPMFKSGYKFGAKVPDEWYEALLGDDKVMAMPKSKTDDWEMTGAHLSVHSRPVVQFQGSKSKKGGKAYAGEGQSMNMGLHLGNNSNVQNLALDRIQDRPYYLTDANHYDIYSKWDWMLKGLLQTGNEGTDLGVSQSAQQALVTRGVDTIAGGQCWEVTALGASRPCMTYQNSAAAIYGLYYYPGCRDERMQWYVIETVPELDKKKFAIQFRCPNPMYGQQDWLQTGLPAIDPITKELHVYEPLNPKNRKFLDKYLSEQIDIKNASDADLKLKKRQSAAYVGGVYEVEQWERSKTEKHSKPHRMHVPRVARKAEHHPCVSPWMYLINSNNVAQIAPFWNKLKQEVKWHGLRDRGDFMRGETLRDLLKGELESNVGEEVAGVAFGFRMSQAFILYPHRAIKAQDGGAIEAVTRQQWAQAERVGYMSEPTAKVAGLPGPNLTAAPELPLAKAILNYDEWFADDVRNEKVWRRKLLSTPQRRNAAGKRVAPAAPTPQTLAPNFTGGNPETAAQPSATVSNTQGPATEDATLDSAQQAALDDMEVYESMPTQMLQGNRADDDAAVQETRSENKRVVTAGYGAAGMSLAETLKECDPAYDFTEDEVRVLMSKATETAQDQRKLTDKQRIILKALEDCDIMDSQISQGDTEVVGDAQCHWATARHSPWSHEQCYEPARVTYEYEVMTPERQEEYERKYGTQATLIQQNSETPKKITDVKVNWGMRRPIMDELITVNTREARLNLARILVIYFADQGVKHFTKNDKQRGMTVGLGRPADSVRNSQSIKVYKRGMAMIWKPVFTAASVKKLSARVKKCLRVNYLCIRNVSSDSELEKCLDHDEPNWVSALGVIESEMTVAEWVTTPWHLEHLPYQPQYATFRDGECYSEGCKRCSRMFYEYAYHVYGDLHTVKGALSYPHDLWYTGDDRLAPRPLHDPRFWSVSGLWSEAVTSTAQDLAEGGFVQPRQPKSKQGKKPLREGTAYEAQAQMREADRDPNIPREFAYYTGGTMGWPGFQLRADFKDGSRVVRTNLHKTDRERKAVRESMPQRGQKQPMPMIFRRYFNVAYQSNKARDASNRLTEEDTEQTYYKGICEGYMFRGNNKVQFGACELRLARSHKYGNVCRDCAKILDRAQMFVRNNRYVFDSGLVKNNQRAIHLAGDDYWMDMFRRVGDDRDAQTNFDALMMKKNEKWSQMTANERQKWEDGFDHACRTLIEAQGDRHKFPDNWTRLVSEPTIHLQDSITRRKDYKKEHLEEAIRDLGKLFISDPATFDARSIRLDNPALRDIVRDAQRRYLQNEVFTRVEYTKQFDSDVKRTEYRNCVIQYRQDTLIWRNPPANLGVQVNLATWPNHRLGKFTQERYLLNGSNPNDVPVFYNCLITDQYDPDLLDTRITDFSMPRQATTNRVEVYLATRRNPGGDPEHPIDRPTQWAGDGYVCEPDGANPWKLADGVPCIQTRTMRQSRMFITYSLHRPINGEREGRVILERMRDALDTLFGNDRWLSELIVFGKMLKSFKIGTQTADNISKAMWGIIDKTNKASAMENFYGNNDRQEPRTSYVFDTYETHVDSVDVDAGCEIGPKMGHPHFHLLLTLNHFGYAQFDYFKMKTFLEIMFRGIPTFHGWGTKFKLPGNFYGDNENPYVDIRLYPQDNWKEILAAYVRKNAIPSIIEVEAARRMPGTANDRRNAHNRAA